MQNPNYLVPIWPAFVQPILRELAGVPDGERISRAELRKGVFDRMALSDEARADLMESGQSRSENRLGWALTHMTKNGWIERPERAHYRMLPAGREWLDRNPNGLETFAEANQVFSEAWAKTSAPAEPYGPAVGSGVAPGGPDPVEQLEIGWRRARDEVKETLLTRLRVSHPDFFEQAVVDVLLAMGYGGADQRGKRIGGSGDGGVDGVIDQDALGLDQIYVQAKRYAEGNTVGREAIQAFIGALHGLGASRGVFLTSSKFSAGAIDYASKVPTRIVLIDGDRLTDLMVKYGVGVQVKTRYEIYEVDEDFFE